MIAEQGLNEEPAEASIRPWARAIHRLRFRLAARRRPRAGFDAFISYSHAADAGLAPILQRSLHGFARPWFRRRAMRVFRDISSLAATAGLASAIEGVLRETRYLILLASPRAKKSPWVAREVSFWCENKSSETLLIVVTDGDFKWDDAANDFDWEATSALPTVLTGQFAEEPLVVDLRWARSVKRLGPRHPSLREATATLAAAIHGRPRDSLIGDDIRRHRHAIQVAVLAGVLILGFAGVATWQYGSARRERDNAIEQAQQATSLALSASSRLQLEDHPKTALLLGLEAYKLRQRPEARSALVAALQVAARTGAGPILRGHSDIARAAVFTPSGQTLVSGGDDGLVRVWDVQRRRERDYSPLKGHDNIVMAVDVSPDGRTVASGAWDGTVRLWRLGRQQPDGGTVLRRGGAVDSVAFSRHGNLLAVASGPDVEVWAYRRGDQLTELTVDEDVDQVSFSPDGRYLAGAIGVSGAAFLWDLSTGSTWPLHHGGIATAVGFSQNGQVLAVGGLGDVAKDRPGTVSRWDVRSHEIIGRPVHTGTDLVRGVALTRDGRTLFAAGQEGNVARVDVDRARVLGQLPDVSERSGIWGLAGSPDRNTLAIPVSDGSVRLWNVRPASGSGTPLRGSGGDVTGVAVSRHGALAAAAHEGGSIDLWDAGTGRVLDTLEDQTGVSAVAFQPTGQRVVFAARGRVRVWNPRAGQVTAMRSGTPEVASLAVSRDGATAATGEYEGRVRLWDLRRREQIGAPIETPDTVPKQVSFVAFSPDGGSVAFAAGDFMNQEIRLVDVDTREVDASAGGIWPLESGVVMPDGAVRAATIKNPFVTVVSVDPLSKRRIRVDSASAAAFSPNGATLAVGDDNGSVQAWDAGGLIPLGSPFRGDSSRVTRIAFSADGETLAAGGENGAIRVWQHVFWSDLDEIEARACRDAGSNIPRAEWAVVAPGIPYRASCG